MNENTLISLPDMTALLTEPEAGNFFLTLSYNEGVKKN